MQSMIEYAFVIVLGLGLAAAIWFPMRRRHPLTVVRVALVLVVAGATGYAIWLHEPQVVYASGIVPP
jgi:hypothetical protein